ncbi:MAG: LTA synthase family protein [Methylobacter sp.]
MNGGMIGLFKLVLLISPLVLKGIYVDSLIQHYTGIRLLGFCQVLANDVIFYCVLSLLLCLSFLPRVNRLFGVLLRLAALVMFAVYVADYLVIVNFDTHLVVGDIIKYAGYAYRYVQQIYGLNDIGLGFIIAAIFTLLLIFIVGKRETADRSGYKGVMLMLAVMPLASGFADKQKYAHSWMYQNVVDYNLTILSEASPYSDKFVQAFNFSEPKSCEAEPGKQKNIIILMVESLSAYQSQFFSGINNWTPNIDSIAERNQAFKNFYANGFITEDGEIALLTGLLPIYPPSSYSDDGSTSFYSFFNIQNSLPNLLKKHGYQTEFLTTADLEFGNTGNWAKSIGFDYVEGHDHPEYDKWERFHFQSAPDEALYLRALDRVKQNKGKEYFIFIKTVSSHHPYVNPENKHKSESEAIIYTDKQIGRFYRQLQDDGFFNNGILVIVGDHHSMTPLKKIEFDNYGAFKAAAKVPLIIADGGIARVETNQYQQIDIFNSLRGMVNGRQCYSDWNGILFGEHKTPPKYIAHRRGDNRDIVSIFTENDDFLVKLDGDNTRLADDRPEDQTTREMLVNKINAVRIARSRTHELQE